MDTKIMLDKLKKKGVFSPPIEEKDCGGVDDFKVHNYKLIIRDHYTDLWNLHKKKIRQWYGEIHKNFLDYKFDKTNNYSKNFCPIYFITFSIPGIDMDETTELLFYVGKTNQKENRFLHGHRATQKLLNPAYHNFDKHIYFAQVLVSFHYAGEDYIDYPIEWLEPNGIVDGMIRFLEYFFIFNESTRLGNEDGLDKEEIGIKYREWEDYWPQTENDEELGITIEVDDKIYAPYLKSSGEMIWRNSFSDRFKRKLFEYLDKEQEGEEE
ncbi:hypothetical protein [Bacillus cereus]|uniref:hypothetical protein n=1 Tax=Bacillus cereus TaxID=1396 RepID=UPI0037FD19EE